jgi:hypothetical protein
LRYQPGPTPTRVDQVPEFLARELRRIATAIEDPFPHGRFSMSASSATTIAVAGTYYKAAGATVAGHMNNMSMPADNRLQYNNPDRKHFHIATSVSFTTTGASQTVSMKIAKNGTPNDATIVSRLVGTGTDIGSTALHSDEELGMGDYLELWVTNETSTNSVTIDELYFFAVGMPLFT